MGGRVVDKGGPQPVSGAPHESVTGKTGHYRCARFPLHNSLPTTILPVCLFSGFPSDTRQSVLGFTIWGNIPGQLGGADTLSD
jgi:hypothetical protein